MGYGLIREFAEVLGRWWREKNNEVNRKHVMPGRNWGAGGLFAHYLECDWKS